MNLLHRMLFSLLCWCYLSMPLDVMRVLLSLGASKRSHDDSQVTLEPERSRRSRNNNLRPVPTRRAASDGSLTSATTPNHSPLESLRSTSACSEHQWRKLEQLKLIHDFIELNAYAAVSEVVRELDLHALELQPAESQRILQHVKCKAHREMYKAGGYMQTRGQYVEPSQVKLLLQRVGDIIHDRDTKLTNATYLTLPRLIMALDDHNTMVKCILLQSWTRVPNKVEDDAHAHVQEIQRQAEMFDTLRRFDSEVFGDLQLAVAREKAEWNVRFPGLREDSRRAHEFVARANRA
jgi:hypothetical protein